MLLGHHFFFIQFEFGLWPHDDGKVRVLFQQHQNRTKDSCYAQKTSFFRADVVASFSLETLYLSRDSIIFLVGQLSSR